MHSFISDILNFANNEIKFLSVLDHPSKSISSLWCTITMKLGFGWRSLALAALLVPSQAQCPDYTTYSEVGPDFLCQC